MRSLSYLLRIGATALIVASCSGSGGSTSGGGAFSISPSSLTVNTRGGAALPPPQDVNVTANGAEVYVKTEVSGAAVESATVHAAGSTTATISVQPASPAMLPDGTSMAQVKVIGCADPVCSHEVPGSPKVIEVTYNKAHGGLTGTPNALSFTQVFGESPPPDQTVMLRDLGGASLAWTSSVLYETGNGAGWLVVTPAGGGALPATASVGIQPLASPGTYKATIQFGQGTASLFPVDVTYAVTTVSSAFQVMPSSLNVVGAFGTTTPPQMLSLSDGQGGSYAWTAQVEWVVNDLSGWITLAPMSGSSLPATLTLTLGALPDRLTHQAILHVVGAGTERTIQISYRTP